MGIKINIIENTERKTITVILGGVRFYSAKYLLERYEGERYFGNGILNIDAEGMRDVLSKISKSLNLVNPDVKFPVSFLFEGKDIDYPLFKRHLDMEGAWDKTYEVSIGAYSKTRDRHLFFEDLQRKTPVTNEDVIKEYEWGIELELSTKIDEDTKKPKLLSILHRIVRGKQAETQYRTNDSAWEGFDFSDDVDEEKTSNDDEMPF